MKKIAAIAFLTGLAIASSAWAGPPQPSTTVEHSTTLALISQLTEALLSATHEVDAERAKSAAREAEWQAYVAPLLAPKDAPK